MSFSRVCCLGLVSIWFSKELEGKYLLWGSHSSFFGIKAVSKSLDSKSFLVGFLWRLLSKFPEMKLFTSDKQGFSYLQTKPLTKHQPTVQNNRLHPVFVTISSLVRDANHLFLYNFQRNGPQSAVTFRQTSICNTKIHPRKSRHQQVTHPGSTIQTTISQSLWSGINQSYHWQNQPCLHSHTTHTRIHAAHK